MSKKEPFWAKKWGREAICPIAHTRLRPGKDRHGIPYVRELRCGHRFWRRSIDEWVKSQTGAEIPLTCPVCRGGFTLVDYLVPYVRLHGSQSFLRRRTRTVQYTV